MSVPEDMKEFASRTAAMVFSGVIVFYLTTKGVLSDLVFANFQGVDFIEYLLLLASLILIFGTVVRSLPLGTTGSEEDNGNSIQETQERDFHTAEVVSNLGEVEEHRILVTGCLSYQGVNHTAHLLENGEIQIENVRCPNCNTRLVEEQEGGDTSFPTELQERIDSERNKEEIRTAEPRRALVCPHPNCKFFVVKDVSRPSTYHLESIFDNHFRKIKNHADLSIESLKQSYRERTGESNPGPSEIWHEYYLQTDANEVCSEIED